MKEHSQFPISHAFAFAMQGLRLRLGRMALVLAGVSVAIALTTVMLSNNPMFAMLDKDEAGLATGMTSVPVFRYLWVGVALLICTVGIFNAVVMSVTERIKEIGTLKCLGSRNIHVIQIFLFESILLGMLGGTLGGLLGYGAALLNFIATVGSKYLTSAIASAAAVNILWCMGIAMALSLLASIVPVYMATKVEPAAAMRYEV